MAHFPHIGQRFAALTLVTRAESRLTDSHMRWVVKCDCGLHCQVIERDIVEGLTENCGCNNQREVVFAITDHPLYNVYRHMVSRCTDPTDPSYKYYGARGITIEWKSYAQFFYDMAPQYTPGLTIERKDNDGPYSRANCKFATYKEQANNRSNNRKVMYQGETFSLSQLAERLDLPYDRLYMRLYRGYSVEEAVTKPVKKPLATVEKVAIPTQHRKPSAKSRISLAHLQNFKRYHKESVESGNVLQTPSLYESQMISGIPPLASPLLPVGSSSQIY